MRVTRTSLAILGVLLASCQGTPPQTTYTLDQVPAEFARPVAAADSAIAMLQLRLSKRVLEEMGRGGPAAAIQVCRNEARLITTEVAHARGIDVGRTSHRLRNRDNEPRDWVRPHIEGAAGKKAGDVGSLVVDLGTRVGVLRPITMGRICLACHGAEESIAPDVALVLRAAYPGDRAVGFAEGDLRGYFWAEAPK